jgi:hypothetical protein
MELYGIINYALNLRCVSIKLQAKIKLQSSVPFLARQFLWPQSSPERPECMRQIEHFLGVQQAKMDLVAELIH